MQAKPLGQQHLLLNSLQTEKDLAERKLRQAQAQVMALEIENATLKSEAEETKGYCQQKVAL